MATLLMSLLECQIKWEIVANFCGLFRMSELYKFAYVYVQWGQSYFEVALELFLIYFLVFQLIMFKSLENISSNQMRRNI